MVNTLPPLQTLTQSPLFIGPNAFSASAGVGCAIFKVAERIVGVSNEVALRKPTALPVYALQVIKNKTKKT
jgi:hypothetical protein